MPLALLFRRFAQRPAVMAAYHRIVERARDPWFFSRWGIPDTLDGRFETLALHAFLVLNRLRADHEASADFAQRLFDTMFADLDRALREMGATDVGVGRHVKAMARGFYGRSPPTSLASRKAAPRSRTRSAAIFSAPRRRFHCAAEAATYMRRQAAALAGVPTAALLSGDVPFAPVAAEDD